MRLRGRSRRPCEGVAPVEQQHFAGDATDFGMRCEGVDDLFEPMGSTSVSLFVEHCNERCRFQETHLEHTPARAFQRKSGDAQSSRRDAVCRSGEDRWVFEPVLFR